MEKKKKTLKIALFVSLASLIKFDFIVDGFIIAMSVLVMAIFIYCYEDLSALYISYCSGIFSPLFRLLTIGITTGNYSLAAKMAIPDMAYFFSYGIFYTLIYRFIIREPKNIKNFPYAIFFCDVLSNMAELLSRSLVQRRFLLDFTFIGVLLILTLSRTILIQTIVVALEGYSNLLIKEEHDREYRRLMEQASIFESELHIMEKNSDEIETIMKKAYGLYKSMEKLEVPKKIKSDSLEIAKDAHEIKGDYHNIIQVLTGTFIEDLESTKLSIKDILLIEKSNIQSIIKQRNFNIELHFSIRTNFYIHAQFKMMSIIRNLLLNAVEAIGEKGGRVSLTLREENKVYILTVRDNGTGISEKNIEDIFLDGYSSKFNERTGDIQRGIGLTVVKDYVENYFQGKIEVESRENEFTEFRLCFPTSRFNRINLQVVQEDNLNS